MNSLIQEMECHVHGNVQGVSFRVFVAKKAKEIGVFGFIRNCEDGRVEVVAQGTKSDLEDLLAYLRIGSPHAEVEKVEVEWCDPIEPYYKSFDIKYSPDE